MLRHQQEVDAQMGTYKSVGIPTSMNLITSLALRSLERVRERERERDRERRRRRKRKFLSMNIMTK